MATLYIRNIPDKVYQIIKRRAKSHRRSINQETVIILEQILLKRKSDYDIWDEIDLIREKIFEDYGSFGDSAPLISEDRKR